MIGAAAAMHRGQHTALDYFRDRMGFTARRVTLLITNALVALLLLSMIKVSLVLVPNAQLQRSAGLDLPLGWVFLAVPVGSLLILVPMIRTIVVTLRELWQKPSLSSSCSWWSWACPSASPSGRGRWRRPASTPP